MTDPEVDWRELCERNDYYPLANVLRERANVSHRKRSHAAALFIIAVVLAAVILL
jgi:hypothetical protein